MIDRILAAKISGRSYFLWGCGLLLVKRLLDCWIAHRFGVRWSFFDIWDYWLPLGQFAGSEVQSAGRLFALVLAFAALPFACVGVVLTAIRLHTLNRREIWAALFFVPIVNLAFFLSLSVMRPAERVDGPRTVPARGHRAINAIAISTLLSAAVGVVLVVLLTRFAAGYAWGLFLGVPFLTGVMAAFWCARFGLPGIADAFGVTMGALLVDAALLLFLAIEGALCLAMAAPMAIPVALVGAAIGRKAFARGWRPETVLVPLLILTPLLNLAPSSAPLRSVETSLDIAAPPEVVWRNVVQFSELPPPREWFFRAGVAYPVRARIEGSGPGAVRYCRFSTGDFVEPIRVWDEPRLLQFGVTANPEPLHELSPYDIHPPHLRGYFESRKGQFLLRAAAWRPDPADRDHMVRAEALAAAILDALVGRHRAPHSFTGAASHPGAVRDGICPRRTNESSGRPA